MAQVDVKWPSEDEEFDTKTAETNDQAAPESEQAPEAAAAPVAAEPEAAPEETAEPEEPVTPHPDPAPQPSEPVAEPKPAPAAVAPSRSGHSWGRLFMEVLLLVAVAALVVWGLNLQSKNKNLQKQVDSLNNNPALMAQNHTNAVVGKVASLTSLPTGEQPQVVTITSTTALKKQYPALTALQTGDEVLIYFKAGKVIVYRPSTGKVVVTVALSITSQTATPATSTTTSTTPTTKH